MWMNSVHAPLQVCPSDVGVNQKVYSLDYSFDGPESGGAFGISPKFLEIEF